MPSQKSIEFPPEYDTLHVGIALYDPVVGTVLDANERFEQVLGYSTEQLRDLSVETYTANTYPHSGSEFRDRLRGCAAGTAQEFTWRAKRANGELVWVQIHLSGQRLADRTYVRAEMRDITGYYETSHRAELFWRVLRHNLRNKATVILGNTDTITARAEAETVRDAAATIQAQGENLGRMATAVKEIETAVANTEAQRVRRHATTAVEDVVNEVKTDYPGATIALDEREEMGVNVDAAFTQALTHALENAIVHSDRAEPVVEVSIGPSPNTGRVEICITDTNLPIPDDELEALFTPTETTSTSHGSGVGLFVMKWCVESLGGEIRFETREPRGNAVYIYLPPKTPPNMEDDDRSTKRE